MPDLDETSYHYCATKGCRHRVPKTSVVLDPCPACKGTEYANHMRKTAIDKGVQAAQKLESKAEQTKGDDGKGDDDSDPADTKTDPKDKDSKDSKGGKSK